MKRLISRLNYRCRNAVFQKSMQIISKRRFFNVEECKLVLTGVAAMAVFRLDSHVRRSCGALSAALVNCGLVVLFCAIFPSVTVSEIKIKQELSKKKIDLKSRLRTVIPKIE
jgi:hypothetical protein